MSLAFDYDSGVNYVPADGVRLAWMNLDLVDRLKAKWEEQPKDERCTLGIALRKTGRPRVGQNRTKHDEEGETRGGGGGGIKTWGG